LESSNPDKEYAVNVASGVGRYFSKIDKANNEIIVIINEWCE
jgi:hypothetical protein